MKFLIDENITPAVVAIFTRNGLHAHHINQFKSTKTQRIHDDQLRRLSLYREYVIVTRDDDFVSSYVSRKVPDQMIFIYNLDKKDILLDTFSRHIDKIPGLVRQYDFLEINDQGIRMPFA